MVPAPPNLFGVLHSQYCPSTADPGRHCSHSTLPFQISYLHSAFYLWYMVPFFLPKAVWVVSSLEQFDYSYPERVCISFNLNIHFHFTGLGSQVTMCLIL